MSPYKTPIQGVSIVLIGSFNPAIFQPAWFAAQGLISEAEATNAMGMIVTGEVSSFALEWVTVQVLREQFIAGTVGSPSPEILRDFVLGTLTVLHHTPIEMLGMNSDRHVETQSEEEWHKIGKWLAPPDPWAKVLKEPGLRSLSMQGKRPDDYVGMINVKVEPSSRVKYGVYMNLNDHYVLGTEKDKVGSAEGAIEIIRDQWKIFLARAEEVAQAIFGESA